MFIFSKESKDDGVESSLVQSICGISFFTFLLLLLDAFARRIADFKIKMSRNPHLWTPVLSTKEIPIPFVESSPKNLSN